MEKILMALDPFHLNTSAIDFACYIARLNRSRLTGVFLEGLLPENYPVVSTIGRAASGEGQITLSRQQPDNVDAVKDGIRRFRESCICRDTLSLIHRDRDVPLSEVIEESRFADLIIVDPETSFSRSDRALPSRFVKDVLEDSECPVIIAPYSFEGLDTIVFAYNGSPSSVFAIKQFTYLFPALSSKKAIIVNVRDDEAPMAIEKQFKMKEWLKVHYEDLEFVILKGDPSDQLFGYLIEKKNTIVVMGAYGRTMLSRFFKPSHARLIVKTINLPVFVAHQ